MDRDRRFWEERQCFLPPPSALLKGMEMIDAAGDRLLAGELEEAEQLLLWCDHPEIANYVNLVQGPTQPDVHRFRTVPNAPPTERIRTRMPSATAQKALFARDGYRCRFCGLKVVLRAAVKRLDLEFPAAIRWSGPQSQQHPAFRASCASADHLVPHSRGGSNEPDNLVTACGPCQFGRNQWLISEVGLNDPRSRPPVIDGWDGLSRLL